jgi:cyclopropane fatty-acyl-phospholipid synthase-like methyltransferase
LVGRGPDARDCVRKHIDMTDTDHRLRPVAVEDARQFSPSAARNRVPIREVLTRVLPKKGIVLEIGSGTGEHVVCFAKALPRLVWLPSDPDEASRTSIEAWMISEGLTNVRAPVAIDVREEVWGVEDDAPFDAMISLNMVHIAPWEAALGLLAGGKRLLRPDGVLFLYGPFMIGGKHTARTNAAFDADLKQRDPRWGVRDIDDIVSEAMSNGLEVREVVNMPANNLSLVLVKSSSRSCESKS